jgi:hypothetical protein
MANPERQPQLTEIDELVIQAYQQRLPLKQIDLLQTPHEDLNSLLKGKHSEIRAKVLIATINIVQRVTWGTKKEDETEKIDLWVEFLNESGHPKIPVQVKSRRKNANSFLNGDYGKNRRIIALNAGPFNQNYAIKQDFCRQLRKLDGFL